ncbi:MAG: SAM-dependent methyltransferase, partial [Betaproteobacteria bacterium]
MRARLFLIPSTLGESAAIETVPAATLSVLHRLEHLVVESPKPARRFLQAAGLRLGDRSIRFYVLDEHTPDSALPELLAVLLSGADVGLLSDAGCPAIADPGARLVRLAHEHGIEVMPMVGPSSITLALMASGLNGQRFAFHGYLPVEPQARARALLA